MKRTYEDHLKDQQQTSSSSTTTNSSHQTDEPPIGTVNNTSNNTINSTHQILTQQHAFHQPSHQATVNSNPMMIPINNNNTNSTIPSNSHHNRIQSNAGITSSLINQAQQPSQSINNSSIRLQQQNFEQALKKPKINPQQQQQSTTVVTQ